MRILQFANTLDVSDGGPARNAFELNVSTNRHEDISNQLFFFNHGASKWVFDDYDGAAGELPIPGPLQIGLRNAPEEHRVGLGRCVNMARGADIAILHGYYLPWSILVAVLLILLKVPFVITPHGSLTSHQQSHSKAKKALYDMTFGRLLRKWSAGFVTGSKIEAIELRQKFPDCAVQVGGVGTVLPEAHLSADRWGEPVRLLCLSRIAPKKRLDLSIHATRVMLDRGYDVRLDIVGAGPKPLEDNLRRLCRDLGLESFVRFHGQKTGAEKQKFLLTSDIYLLPSDDENFGISLAEALAAGLPAVVSDRVAAAEVMDRTAGRVVAAPSAETLADGICDLLAQGRGCSSDGARRCAAEHLSWTPVSMNWISVLSQLSASRNGSSGLVDTR